MKSIQFTEAMTLVKQSLDIVDVVSRHVVLKKTGRNYTGLCPFHADKSPSFNVSREKNLYKCFSCGEAGDAIAFLMKFSRKTFGEVILETAQDLGYDIEKNRTSGSSHQIAADKDKLTLLYECQRYAADFFRSKLSPQAHPQAWQYLQSRELLPETIERFDIGVAPNAWDALYQRLSQHYPQLNAPELEALCLESGLSIARDHKSGVYDRFRNRLMFPIHHERGQVVAFGGRALSADEKPKYLNSPESLLYQKSQILYGLFQAQLGIQKHHRVMIMEGYFDVIRAHECGLDWAVGTCGTALTEGHLKKLIRFGAQAIYLCFDADSAGKTATLRAIEILWPYIERQGLKVYVVQVPNGKDPDDYLASAGAEGIAPLMNTAQDFWTYQCFAVLRELDCTQPEGRIEANRQIVPILAKITHPLVQMELMRQLSDWTQIPEEAWAIELKRYQNFTGQKLVKNNVYNQAINFTQERSKSYQRKNHLKPVPNLRRDNTPELMARLKPKHLQAEETLLRLATLNQKAYSMIAPMLVNLSFETPLLESLRELLCGTEIQDASLQQENSLLQALVRTVQEKMLNDPKPVFQDMIAHLSGWAFEVEAFYTTQGLPSDEADDNTAALKKRVETCLSALGQRKKQQSLVQMANQMKALETSMLQPGRESHVVTATKPDCGMSGDVVSVLKIQYQMRDILDMPSPIVDVVQE